MWQGILNQSNGAVNLVLGKVGIDPIPWLNEPACRTCHTAQYGEPVGQLYRFSTGHGGLMCSACHGSPHAIFPSREAADNVNNIDLQGHAGTLRDLSLIHI